MTPMDVSASVEELVESSLEILPLELAENRDSSECVNFFASATHVLLFVDKVGD